MKKNQLFISLVICLSLFTFNISGQSDMPADAAKSYNEGNQLMKSGNLDGAIGQYQSALNHAKDYRIYYQLGIALKKKGKDKEAIDAFKSSISANPQFDLAYNGLGGTYFTQGNYAEAVEAFKKFEQTTSKKQFKDKAKEDMAKALVKQGEQSKKDGNYANAISQLNEAIKMSPLDAAYIILATAYYETADYDKTISTTDHVLAMKNSKMHGAANYYKGMAFKQKQDLTKAKQLFEEAKKDVQYRKLAEYELKLLK
ncbi:MAG: tetratricopeptide repeat protein [Melioribacteraceae bacterium]|jgi:tetratricopeptide (TPR) repeat protein|nr:tetratricopeptide repeat protein [Melioribacteraceae bacterium]